jgi:hypothetical protein
MKARLRKKPSLALQYQQQKTADRRMSGVLGAVKALATARKNRIALEKKCRRFIKRAQEGKITPRGAEAVNAVEAAEREEKNAREHLKYTIGIRKKIRRHRLIGRI